MISNKLMIEINTFIHTNLEYYSKLVKPDIIKCKKFIIHINDKYKTTLMLDKLIEMRTLYVYFLAISKGVITSRYGSNIINDYNHGLTVMSISTKYDLPPSSVLYQILIEKQYESHQIKKILKTLKDLPDDLINQIEIINLNTPNIWLNLDKNYQGLTICSKIKAVITVPFVYNNDKKSKIKQPLITFNEDITYNGIKFKWIVVKNHMVFNHTLLLLYVNKIAKRFNHIGSGLILFSDIYCSKQFIQLLEANIGTYAFFDKKNIQNESSSI
jgi:hypothetical protein